MKTFSRLVYLGFLALCAGCATTSGDGSFSLGREDFAPGDFIKILHVSKFPSASGTGVTVAVQGVYNLQSEPDAVLNLNLTTTAGGGRSHVAPAQRLRVIQGAGEFELSIDVTDPGDLHISFYPGGGGSSFGGVYFEPSGR